MPVLYRGSNLTFWFSSPLLLAADVVLLSIILIHYVLLHFLLCILVFNCCQLCLQHGDHFLLSSIVLFSLLRPAFIDDWMTSMSMAHSARVLVDTFRPFAIDLYSLWLNCASRNLDFCCQGSAVPALQVPAPCGPS